MVSGYVSNDVAEELWKNGEREQRHDDGRAGGFSP